MVRVPFSEQKPIFMRKVLTIESIFGHGLVLGHRNPRLRPCCSHRWWRHHRLRAYRLHTLSRRWCPRRLTRKLIILLIYRVPQRFRRLTPYHIPKAPV